MVSLNAKEADSLREEVSQEIRNLLIQMEKDHPGFTEGVATAVASSIGAYGSFTALTLLGVPGLSEMGITSALAVAGGFIGGGMAAGIGVLAAPIAILGIVGYTAARQLHHARRAANLAAAMAKLHSIRTRLMEHAEYFREEIAVVEVLINQLANRKK